jgi:hypothetical protein
VRHSHVAISIPPPRTLDGDDGPLDLRCLSADSILNPPSGRCVDIADASTAPNATVPPPRAPSLTPSHPQVQLYDCNGTGAQLWRFNATTGAVLNPRSGLCLAATASRAFTAICDRSVESTWRVVGSALANSLGCLTISDAHVASGSALVAAPCARTAEVSSGGIDRAQWTFSKFENDDRHCTPGLVSRDGWVIVNDLNRPTFGADGWMAPACGGMTADLYGLFHGLNFKSALKDFSLVSGYVPLVPKFALGVYNSRL